LRTERDTGLVEDDAFVGAPTANEGSLRVRRGAECGFWRDIGGERADAAFEGDRVGRFTIWTRDVPASALCAVVNGPCGRSR